MPPRALFLDIGNVVVRWDERRLLAGLAAAARRTPEEVLCALRDTGLDPLYTEGRLGTAEFVGGVNRALGTSLPLETFTHAWNDAFAPDLDAEALVRELARRLPLFAVTNTNPLHLEHLRRAYPVLREFRGVVASFEARCQKPSAEIFRAALDRAGCAPPETLFVDDLPANVEGAAAVGIPGIVFTGAAALRRELSGVGLVRTR